MKVFISSLISGMEAERAAVREAVEMLRGRAIMAEDFSAAASSPQVTCLQGLREADIVILVLGERYGMTQPSGLSATHEEYREAKGRKPVIAFVQKEISAEPNERDFIKEVQEWEGGLFRGGFGTPNELKDEVVRALHEYEMSRAVGPVDEDALRRRSFDMLPKDSRRAGSPIVTLAVAVGPRQQVLRPAELEEASLAEAIHQAALFGRTQVFDQAQGVEREIEGDTLVLDQERSERRIVIHQGGEMVVQTAAESPSDEQRFGSGFPALIEEYVRQVLGASIALIATILEKIDPTQRLTHVAISAHIAGGDYYAWRTLAEHRASPNSGSMSIGGEDRKPVQVFIHRAALQLDTSRLIDDLLVSLRRQWKGGRI